MLHVYVGLNLENTNGETALITCIVTLADAYTILILVACHW